MSVKELKKLFDDKFPNKQPYNAEDFAKQMKLASKSGLIDFEELEKRGNIQMKNK